MSLVTHLKSCIAPLALAAQQLRNETTECHVHSNIFSELARPVLHESGFYNWRMPWLIATSRLLQCHTEIVSFWRIPVQSSRTLRLTNVVCSTLGHWVQLNGLNRQCGLHSVREIFCQAKHRQSLCETEAYCVNTATGVCACEIALNDFGCNQALFVAAFPHSE